METLLKIDEILRRAISIAVAKNLATFYLVLYKARVFLKHATITTNPAVCPTAGVGPTGMIINTKFADSLGELELIFLLMHEMLHLMWDHISRFIGKDQRVANIACDLAINEFLTELMKIIIEAIKGVWEHDHMLERIKDGCYLDEEPWNTIPKGLSAEDMYPLVEAIIKKQNPPPPPPPPPGRRIDDPPPTPPTNPPPGGDDDPPPGGDDIDRVPGEFPTNLNPEDLEPLKDLLDKLNEQAEEKAKKALDNLQKKNPNPKALTSEKLQKAIDDLNRTNPEAKKVDQAKSNKVTKPKVTKEGKVGVDKIIDITDDESWQEILEPLRQVYLSEDTGYVHDEAAVYAVGQSLGLPLRGRKTAKVTGGEALIILDTSGSTGGHWTLGIAKCLEAIQAIDNGRVALRVVLFSDYLNPKNEFIFYNGSAVEEDELDKASVLFADCDVPDGNVVDVSEYLAKGQSDTTAIIRSKISYGGGTELLPVVDAMKNTIGIIPERFKVVVIITDGELYGSDMSWATSPEVFTDLGEHVSWIFLQIYGRSDFSLFQGENKYLVPVH